jgi:hypothetical protein
MVHSLSPQCGGGRRSKSSWSSGEMVSARLRISSMEEEISLSGFSGELILSAIKPPGEPLIGAFGFLDVCRTSIIIQCITPQASFVSTLFGNKELFFGPFQLRPESRHVLLYKNCENTLYRNLDGL